MEKKEILDLVKTIGKTVRQIEIELGMPQSTLNKAVLGTRELPEKWEQPLLELANPSNKESVKNTTLSKTEEVVTLVDDEADRESEEAFDRMIDHHEELQEHLPDPPEEGIKFSTPGPEAFDGPKINHLISDEIGQMPLSFKGPRPFNEEDFKLYLNTVYSDKKWISEIERFCGANNCHPQELMAAYQQLKKPDTNWLSDLLNKEGS